MRRIRRSPAAPGRRAIDAEASGGRGARYDGPFDGGRVHSKGRVLKWQIGTPTLRSLSFLCGDVTLRPRRFREGEVRVHPNGAQGVGSVTLHVADFDASVARFRALLGPGAAIATRDAVGADIRVALASIVTTTLSTVSPGAEDTDDAGTALRRTLAGRSEGPIGLSTTGPVTITLPSTRAHSTPIEL